MYESNVKVLWFTAITLSLYDIVVFEVIKGKFFRVFCISF